jgi:hypothetical protein
MGRSKKERTPIPASVDRQVRVEAGFRCSMTRCAATSGLEIHHIDGDPSNHDPGNLLLLCAVCHARVTNGEISRMACGMVKALIQGEPVSVDNQGHSAVEDAVSPPDAHVCRGGGSRGEESVVEMAARLRRQDDSDANRRFFFASAEGVKAALDESQVLFDAVEETAHRIRNDAGFVLSAKPIRQGVEVTAHRGFMALDWHGLYENTLDGSYVGVDLWEADPRRRLLRTPQKVQERRYVFDQDGSLLIGWRPSDGGELIPSQRLAEECLKLLIDYAASEHRKRSAMSDEDEEW